MFKPGESVLKRVIVGLIFFLFLTVTFPVRAGCQGKTTIGVVFSSDLRAYQEVHRVFMNKLKEKGYHNLRFIYQRPRADTLAWSNAVRKVVAYDASVIITYGSGATEAALYEAPDLPIVYSYMYEPEKTGIKGKRLYGVGYAVPVSSLLRYLREIKQPETLGILVSEIEPSSRVQGNDILQSCKDFSFNSVVLKVRNREELLLKIKLFQFDALFITESALIGESIQSLYKATLPRGIPIIATLNDAEDYALITLEPDAEEMAEAMVKVFTEALKGRKEKDRSRIVIKRTRLIYNRRVSNQIGLEPSIDLIIGADRIIK